MVLDTPTVTSKRASGHTYFWLFSIYSGWGFNPHRVRKALGDILKSVDSTIGRTLLQTNLQAVGRNLDEVLT